MLEGEAEDCYVNEHKWEAPERQQIQNKYMLNQDNYQKYELFAGNLIVAIISSKI